MRKLCLLSVPLLLLSALSTVAQEDEVRHIVALENAWNQAEMKGDSSALDLLLGDGFVFTDSDGTIKDKAQWLNAVKHEVNRYELLGNSDQKVHVYGDAAVVTGEYRERTHAKGKMLVRRGRYTDTWIKQGGQWKCVATQATVVANSEKPETP